MCCAAAGVVDRVGALGDAGVVRDLRILYALHRRGGGYLLYPWCLSIMVPSGVSRVLGSRFRVLWRDWCAVN